MTVEQLAGEIQDLVHLPVVTGVNGSGLTTLGIGGPVDVLVMASTTEEVTRVVRYARDHSVPLVPLGNGSNTLIQDGGIRGIVLSLKKTNTVDFDGDRVRCGAGVLLPWLSHQVAERGLSGLEFACSIPGTVGASAVMNAGAYGGCMADVVETVTCVDPDGNVHVLERSDLAYRYRNSQLRALKWIVTEVCLRLRPDDPMMVTQRVQEYSALRNESQPSGIKSAGSVLAIPDVYSAITSKFLWKLLLRVFLRLGIAPVRFLELVAWYMRLPKSYGGAVLIHTNLNWIGNAGNAAAHEVLNLAGRLQAAYREKFGQLFDLEIEVLGEPTKASRDGSS